jgi:hypothetical protein
MTDAFQSIANFLGLSVAGGGGAHGWLMKRMARRKPITESWRDRFMRTDIRLLFFMILSPLHLLGEFAGFS